MPPYTTGLQQLNEVFAKHGTRGLLGLLAIPPNGLKAPRVTEQKHPHKNNQFL